MQTSSSVGGEGGGHEGHSDFSAVEASNRATEGQRDAGFHGNHQYRPPERGDSVTDWNGTRPVC